MEGKFKNNKYSMLHVRGVLNFDTESVPVQQFQARCADHILQSTRHPLSKVRRLPFLLSYPLPALGLLACKEYRWKEKMGSLNLLSHHALSTP